MACMSAPLVSPEVDLRDFPYMPLDVLRLRDSDLLVHATADEFRAAVVLWCASWHQIPAASLPDDDKALASLAGYGRDVSGWLEARTGALRHWVKCTDGRLYHPVVAEKANEAWEAKQKQRARTESARAAKAAKCDLDRPPVVTISVTDAATGAATGSKGREEKGREEKEEAPLRFASSTESSSNFLVDGEPPTPVRPDRKSEELANIRREMLLFAERWNVFAGSLALPQIDEIKPGSPREKSALARLREGCDFDVIFAKIRGSPYLRGEVNGFRCTFDFITNPTNYLKILEGNYDENRRQKSNGNRSFGAYHGR